MYIFIFIHVYVCAPPCRRPGSRREGEGAQGQLRAPDRRGGAAEAVAAARGGRFR